MNKINNLSPVLLGIISLTLASISGATVYSVAKNLMDNFNPCELTTIRLILGSITLAALKPKSCKFITRNNIKLALPTAATLAFSMLTVWQGLKYSDTGIAAFIANSEFVLIPIISFLFLRQTISFNTLCLVIVGLIGMLLLSLQRDFSISIGTVYLLASVSGFAVFAILNTALTKKIPSYELTFINLLLSIPFCFVAALFQGFKFHLTVESVLPILYIGPLMTGLRFTLITFGQSKVRPAHMGLIYLWEPITASLIGYLFLGEIFSNRQLVGIALLILTVFGSVYVISQEEGKEAQAA